MDKKERAENGLPTYVEATRTCLDCQTDFLSEWVGNRICPACKAKRESSEEFMFSPDVGSNFVYDLTIEEILNELQSTGNTEQNYEDKGFYED